MTIVYIVIQNLEYYVFFMSCVWENAQVLTPWKYFKQNISQLKRYKKPENLIVAYHFVNLQPTGLCYFVILKNHYLNSEREKNVLKIVSLFSPTILRFV